jgi:O-antigen ligase
LSGAAATAEPASPGWLFWPFLLLVLSAPAALGANRPAAWSALALGLGLVLLAWTILAGRRRSAAPIALGRLAPAAVPFALALAWAGAQAIPWIPAWLADPAWAKASHALGEPLSATISLAPEEAPTGIMRLLAYGAALLLAMQFAHSARREAAILWGVALAGGLYALYGLAVWFTGNEMVLWMPKWTYSDSLTSTFVSRNHYATFAGLGLCAALALIAGALAQGRPDYNLAAALLVLALVLAGALVLTRSRGGVASASLAVLAMIVLFAVSNAPRRARLIFGVAAAGLTAAGLLVAGAGVIARAAPGDVEDWGGRSQIWSRAAAAALDRPLGGGLGAFSDFFPAYGDLQLGLGFGSIDTAHNVYLELAAELGPPIAAALVIGLGWLILRLARSARRLRPGAALAATGACVLVAVHSLAEFSLQIPGVTATWLLLLGAGLGQAERAASGVSVRARPRRGIAPGVPGALAGSPRPGARAAGP